MVFVWGDDNGGRSTKPHITIGIIVICVLAQAWQLYVPLASEEAFFRALGVTPALLVAPAQHGIESPWLQVWPTLLTAMFLHNDLIHLAGNMYALWVFGDNVEDAVGRSRYVALYLGTGIVGSLAEVMTSQQSLVPIIGASGAVAGVMGAYLFLRPQAMLNVGGGMQWPTWLVLPLWLCFNLFYLASGVSGVAWVAHVFGFVAGALLSLLLRRPEWRDEAS